MTPASDPAGLTRPAHLDPGLDPDERARRRAELRRRFADVPFELTDTHLDNYIDAVHRLSTRLDPVSDDETAARTPIVVTRVGPDDVDDVLAFFDHEAFADKPEWAMCYCRFPHVPAERWGDRTWYRNRAELADGLRSGEMRAYVARAEGRIVGWLNASDRARSIHARGDDAGVASTLCFTVAVPWRGRGIARRLLEFAVDDLTADADVRLIEGYARPDPPDPATAFPGPLELYLSCGFAVTDETVADGRLVVVRRPAG